MTTQQNDEHQILRRSDLSSSSTAPINNYGAIPESSRNENDDAGSSSTPCIEEQVSPKSIQWRIYTSHFLSTWSSRVFEFGSVLYLAAIFPETLLPMSLYAIIRGLASVFFASKIGKFIDSNNRLKVVRISIVWQRISIAGSCGLFLLLLHQRSKPTFEKYYQFGLFFGLAFFACMEKISSIMNMVCVEKDWVVTIAKHSPTIKLGNLNVQMRRIDLFCKLFAPLFIATIISQDLWIALIVNFTMNILSIFLEYPTIAQVYRAVPALQLPKVLHQPRDAQVEDEGEDSIAPNPPGGLRHSIVTALKDFRMYFRHPVGLTSFAGALLYCTVLSFGGQMVTFLLVNGYQSSSIAITRGGAVAFEVLATWAAPSLISRIGQVRAGLWFINIQAITLAIGAGIFWNPENTRFLQIAGLVGSTILSRIGLRGFDLCVQLIVQDEVEESDRGTFSSIEAAWQSVFELIAFASTAIFPNPSQFQYPILLSCSAVWTASLLHTIFVRRRRHHLFHFSFLRPQSEVTLRQHIDAVQRESFV